MVHRTSSKCLSSLESTSVSVFRAEGFHKRKVKPRPSAGAEWPCGAGRKCPDWTTNTAWSQGAPAPARRDLVALHRDVKYPLMDMDIGGSAGRQPCPLAEGCGPAAQHADRLVTHPRPRLLVSHARQTRDPAHGPGHVISLPARPTTILAGGDALALSSRAPIPRSISTPREGERHGRLTCRGPNCSEQLLEVIALFRGIAVLHALARSDEIGLVDIGCLHAALALGGQEGPDLGNLP